MSAFDKPEVSSGPLQGTWREPPQLAVADAIMRCQDTYSRRTGDGMDRLDKLADRITVNNRELQRGKRFIGHAGPRLRPDGEFTVVAYEVTLGHDVHVGYLYSRPDGQWVARGLGDLHRPDPPQHDNESDAIQDLEKYLRSSGALL